MPGLKFKLKVSCLDTNIRRNPSDMDLCEPWAALDITIRKEILTSLDYYSEALTLLPELHASNGN
jgi:hypothetical protein